VGRPALGRSGGVDGFGGSGLGGSPLRLDRGRAGVVGRVHLGDEGVPLAPRLGIGLAVQVVDLVDGEALAVDVGAFGVLVVVVAQVADDVDVAALAQEGRGVLGLPAPGRPLDGGGLFFALLKDIAPGSRRFEGWYVCDDEAEASFVPSKSFLGQPPLWRIDVLQDLMHDFELVRRHAIVEWAQSLALSNPQVDEADRLRVFREACETLGVHLPENFEALLVLADRFSSASRNPP